MSTAIMMGAFAIWAGFQALPGTDGISADELLEPNFVGWDFVA
jgi:hypothetical protein